MVYRDDATAVNVKFTLIISMAKVSRDCSLPLALILISSRNFTTITSYITQELAI